MESGLTLDLNRLLRMGEFRPGAWTRGTLTWRYVSSGHRVGSIGYEAELSYPEAAWVRLFYTTTRWNGQKDDFDYKVRLTTTRPNYGGLRWWFLCPATGERAAKLHLPDGGDIFASRQAYRLAYQSQRSTMQDRALDQAVKIRERLGQKGGGIGVSFPPKPRGMHWRTYWRLYERAEEQEAISWACLRAWLNKREGV